MNEPLSIIRYWKKLVVSTKLPLDYIQTAMLLDQAIFCLCQQFLLKVYWSKKIVFCSKEVSVKTRSNGNCIGDNTTFFLVYI